MTGVIVVAEDGGIMRIMCVFCEESKNGNFVVGSTSVERNGKACVLSFYKYLRSTEVEPTW